MSKLIKASILLILTFGLSAAVAKLRKIPAPTINLEGEKLSSKGSVITLEGRGFIKDFNNAHKVLLKKKAKKKKFRLKTISSSPEKIEIQIPDNISYGDYDLYIFLKTKFFKSKKQRIKSYIKLRPKAPKKPKLKFQVIKNKNELADLIEQDQEHELILNLENELKTGKNSLSSFYYEDGYKSLLSETVDIFFLEADKVNPNLKISSESPLQSFARAQETEFDVTRVTHKNIQGLTKTYHLQTPSDDLYLATHLELSPLYIKEAHVKTPEYLVLKNRDSKGFDLSQCEIHDEISSRYQFEDYSTIEANKEFKIEGKLSLNDSGDTIQIVCADKVIDELSYTKADAEGFASN